MGRYIDWQDVVDRYPEIDSLGGADEIGLTYVDYAEAFVDGALRSHFTPPFSSNNVTVRDLSIDCVFWRAGRHKLDDAKQVRKEFFETIKMLRSGQLSMIDTSGEVIAAETNPSVFSTTESYHSAFGVDDVIYHRVDSDHMLADQDARS